MREKTSAWRLEPEEETEVPEIIVVSDAVEKTYVDLGGKKTEKESDCSGIRRNARLRKRSKECGARSSGREDFCTKCVSVPQKMIFRCDKWCSEKSLSYWPLASVVIDEGEESYTTNLCHKCFNNSLKAKGEKPLTYVQWRQAVEKKVYREMIWRMMGKEPYVRGM